MKEGGNGACLAGALSHLLTWTHYYVYVNQLRTAAAPPCSVPDLEFTCRELAISLSAYERQARAGADAGKWQSDPASGDARVKSFVFVTTSSGVLVNVTGMTATLEDSVYTQIRDFWPAYDDHPATLFAGYSVTTREFRRRGVYRWVHANIFTWARGAGYDRVILLEGEDQPGPRSSQHHLGSEIVAQTCLLTLLPALPSRYRFHHWITSPATLRLLNACRT